MIAHEYGMHTKVIPDPIHFGKYEVKLEDTVSQSVDVIHAAIEYTDFILVDMDERGMTYLSHEDANFLVDIDNIDASCSQTLLTLHKYNVPEHDLIVTEEYLRTAHSKIVSSIELFLKSKK